MQVFQAEGCLRQDLTFTADGRWLLIGAQTRVLVDTLGSEPPKMLKPPTGEFTAYAQLSLDGRVLVYTTPTDNVDIHVWDLARNEITVWEGAGRNAKDLAASPDGTTIYVSTVSPKNFSWLTELIAFDVATGQPKERYRTRDGHFSWLTISADGRRLAGRDSWNAIVWDLATPVDPESAIVEIRAGKIGSHLAGIALSADGTRLATITNHGLTFWEVGSGLAAREVFRSGKHRRSVTAVACSPTRPLLITGDNAGHVFLWDNAGHVLTRYNWNLGEIYGLTFAPDGLRCAAVSSAGKVVVWDVDV